MQHRFCWKWTRRTRLTFWNHGGRNEWRNHPFWGLRTLAVRFKDDWGVWNHVYIYRSSQTSISAMFVRVPYQIYQSCTINPCWDGNAPKIQEDIKNNIERNLLKSMLFCWGCKTLRSPNSQPLAEINRKQSTQKLSHPQQTSAPKGFKGSIVIRQSQIDFPDKSGWGIVNIYTKNTLQMIARASTTWPMLRSTTIDILSCWLAWVLDFLIKDFRVYTFN